MQSNALNDLWLIIAIIGMAGGGYFVWLLHMQSVIMIMQEDIKKLLLLTRPPVCPKETTTAIGPKNKR